jgi:hypothetical protein
MNAPEPVEMAFFHPNTGTWAVLTWRVAALNSPTVRVNVSLRNPRGVEFWRLQRWEKAWQKWCDRVLESPPLPTGWRSCELYEVPQ